jgi:hypothetical protein
MIDNWTQEEKEFEESVPIKTTKESPSVLSVHKVQIAEDDILAQYDKTFILTAKAERNGVQKDAEDLEYRVTAPAQEPVVERGEQFYSLPADAPITIGVEASVENMVSDEVKYQWWMSAGELDNLGDDDIIEGANTAYIKIADKNLAPQEGVFNTGVGSFYCVVTNCVNGTEASIISDRIGVFPG